MVSRLVPTGLLAAIAGAALFVAASSSPSPAFTLSSPSLEQPVVSADVQDAYWGHCGGWGWHRGGYWHRPWGWHRWGYWHRPWGWHAGVIGLVLGVGIAGAEAQPSQLC
jgi:hypothetical protein